MAINLGGNQINKAYLGTTEIQKMYLGADLVFDNSIQPSELTPIMTNFRVEDATPTQVHFDTPLGPVTGMNITGFVISGKTITGVDTTNNYFTVDSAFDYLDNNTIRLGENDSLGDVNTTVHNFTLEYIKNNIDEPVSTGNKYVTATASGGNGSEGSPWTLQESFDQAVGGETVWVKAGDYGTFQDNIESKNGTASAPIKWIGYKDTIGDITTNYWDYGVTMVNTEMPTFTGTADYNIRFNNSSYLILRNFQFRGGASAIERSGEADYIEMDRFNINQMSDGIVLFQDTANSQLKNIRLVNSVVNCYGLQNIIIRGAEANMIKDCKAYVDGTAGPADYTMTIGGQNSMVIGSYIENFLSNQGSLHGISIRDAYRLDSSYNLVQDCESINFQECYAFRNIGASYNVVKNSIARNNGSTSSNDQGGVVHDGSGAYNVTENVTIKDLEVGIGFYDDTTESGDRRIGDNAIFKNCIVSNCQTAIYIAGNVDDLSTNEGISFYNNTFKDCDNLTFQHSYFLNLNGGIDMVNNIIDSVPVGFSTSGDYAQPTPSDFTFINNDFFNTEQWANGYIGIDGNIGEDPQLDASFVPQATFAEISKARIDGVYYDIDGVTRADPTTLGSKLSPSEDAGEQPPVEADYYVSFTDGLDTNPGTLAEPWKTLAKVQSESSTFVGGDVIAFKSGDTWTEVLTLVGKSGDVGNPITYTSYGSGDKPIFNIVEDQTTTWINKTVDIWYQTSITALPARLKIDSIEVLQGDYDELGVNLSPSGTDSDAVCQWNKSDQGDGGTYLYIYSTTDPNGRSFEWSTESRVLYMVGSDNLEFNNIEFKGGRYESIKLSGCDNLVFDNITNGDMSYIGLSVIPDAGVMSSEVSVTNSTFDSNFTIDFGGAGTESKEHRAAEDGILYQGCIGGVIANNYVKNWGHSGIATGSEERTNTITGLKIYDNYLTAPDIPYGGGWSLGTETTGNELYRNVTEFTATHNKASGYQNHVHHNIIKDMIASPIKYQPVGFGMVWQTTNISYDPTPGTSCQQNIVENNIMINCESGGFKTFAGTIDEPLKDNILRNNIMINCGSTNSNIGLAIHYYTGMDNKENTYENNIIYSASSVDVVSYPTSESTFELLTVPEFNAKNGDIYLNTIANNLADEPLFVGVDDYHQLETSPSVNAGTTSLAILDYEGNTIPYPGTVPDIGIYESDYTGQGTGNLVTNGDFENGDTGWILEAGWTVGGGTANYDGVAYATMIYQESNAVAGSDVTVSLTEVTGNVRVRLGASTWQNYSGTPLVFTNITTPYIYFQSTNDISSMDDVSMVY